MRAMIAAALLTAMFAPSALSAQEMPAMPKPQKEHEWLQQLVGEWTMDSEVSAGPGQPAMTCKGTISSRTLGGFWIVSEVKSEMAGMPFTAVQAVGYDTQGKKYVGTWVDSAFGHLWKYEGSVDETGKILTLEAEGPNFLQPGKMAQFRDSYEFKSKDHVATSSAMQGDDGKWVVFMTGNAKRKEQKSN